MSPKPVAKPLTPAEYLEKVSGPKIDIYVGPKRKHFSVPKGLLTHYSRYFERYFKRNFKEEGHSDSTVILSDNNADDFALIVDYVYRKGVLNSMTECTDIFKIKRCLQIIEFVGKLEFGEAASIIYTVLKDILTRHANTEQPMALIEPHFIRIAFEVIPAKHEVLVLLSQAALPETMQRSGGKYDTELNEVRGFLEETWRQFHNCREEIQFSTPLKPSKKRKL